MNNNCTYYFSSGEGKREISELWISVENSSFLFRHFEDEWDDWPYPHTMEHILSGSVKRPQEIIPSADRDFLKMLSENPEFILERMVYQTLTEDDLFYERTMEIFDLQKEDDSVFNESFTELCQKKEGTVFPVRPETGAAPKNFHQPYPASFIILKVPVSKWPQFNIRLQSENLIIPWIRFPRKWSRHSDGTDVVCGGVPAETVLSARTGDTVHKGIPEILSVLKKS